MGLIAGILRIQCSPHPALSRCGEREASAASGSGLCFRILNESREPGPVIQRENLANRSGGIPVEWVNAISAPLATVFSGTPSRGTAYLYTSLR